MLKLLVLFLSFQQIFGIEGISMKKIMLIDEFKLVNYAGGIEQVVCGFANDLCGVDTT